MSEMYDLVLSGARVVDPHGGVDRRADVGVLDGRIAAINDCGTLGRARALLDLSGKVVVPGIIDPHVHLRDSAGGPRGYQMVAQTGVTTAVDFAGPAEQIVAAVANDAKGLNIAVLNALLPGINISTNDPSAGEIADFVDRSMAQGAVGIKILGGHYPLTPEATARAVEVANQRKVYLGFHVGTTKEKGDYNGFVEAVSLVGNAAAHIAHVNSYCRGQVMDPLDEVTEILRTLRQRERIVSESYLALTNGTSGKCADGQPLSRVTKTCLRNGGFAPTETGLRAALRKGYAMVNAPRGGTNVLVNGRDALEAWLEAKTDVMLSFNVNNPQAMMLCATARNRRGDFVVDALSTDGGGIVRNVLVEKGLLLVKLGALTLQEFVLKSSYNPSRMFGMLHKGHLGTGAEADITVLDLEQGRAILSVSSGRIVMVDQQVIGQGGTLLVCRQGGKTARARRMRHQIIDPSEGLLYAAPGTTGES